MRFEFGMVVSNAYFADARVLVLAPLNDPAFAKETWAGIVLADPPHVDGGQWSVGQIITVSPHTSGIIVVEEAGWWSTRS